MDMSRIALLCIMLTSCGGEAPSVPLDGEPAVEATPDHARDSGRPLLSRFSPHQGLAGTEVQILGDFADDRSKTSVTIGGAPARILDDQYILTIEVPTEAETGPLCVTEDDRTVCGEDFIVLTGPILYSISPNSVLAGSEDTTIEMHGDGFTEGMEVWLYRSSPEVTYHSARLLSVVVPAVYLNGAGTLELYLSKRGPPGEGVTDPGMLTIENPGPAPERIEPVVVPVGEDVELTLFGRGFVRSSVVLVDSVELETELVSDGVLVARLPVGRRPGEHGVQVQNPAPGGGVSAPLMLTVE